jgi:hypothetical protein
MPVLRNAAYPSRQKRLVSCSTQLTLTVCCAIVLLAGCASDAHKATDTANDEPIGTVRQIYDGALTPDMAVHTFRHIDKLFPTRHIARGNAVSPLPEAPRQLSQVKFVSNGKNYDLFDFLALDRVSRVRQSGGASRRRRPVRYSPPCRSVFRLLPWTVRRDPSSIAVCPVAAVTAA